MPRNINDDSQLRAFKAQLRFIQRENENAAWIRSTFILTIAYFVYHAIMESMFSIDVKGDYQFSQNKSRNHLFSDTDHSNYWIVEMVVLVLALPILTRTLTRKLNSNIPNKLKSANAQQLSTVPVDHLKIFPSLNMSQQRVAYEMMGSPRLKPQSFGRQITNKLLPYSGFIPPLIFILTYLHFYYREFVINQQIQKLIVFSDKYSLPEVKAIALAADTPLLFEITSFHHGIPQLDQKGHATTNEVQIVIEKYCTKQLQVTENFNLYGMMLNNKKFSEELWNYQLYTYAKTAGISVDKFNNLVNNGIRVIPKPNIEYTKKEAVIFVAADQYRKIFSGIYPRTSGYHNQLKKEHYTQLNRRLNGRYKQLAKDIELCIFKAVTLNQEVNWINAVQKIYVNVHNYFRSPIGNGLNIYFNRSAEKIVMPLEFMHVVYLLSLVATGYVEKKYKNYVLRTIANVYTKIESYDMLEDSFTITLKGVGHQSLQNWLSLFFPNVEVHNIHRRRFARRKSYYASIPLIQPLSLVDFYLRQYFKALPVILIDETANKLKASLHKLIVSVNKKIHFNVRVNKAHVSVEQIFNNANTTVHLTYDTCGAIDYKVTGKQVYFQEIHNALLSISQICTFISSSMKNGVVSVEILFNSLTMLPRVNSFLEQLNNHDQHVYLKPRDSRSQGYITSTQAIYTTRPHRRPKKKRLQSSKKSRLFQQFTKKTVVQSRYLLLSQNDFIEYIDAEKKRRTWTNVNQYSCYVFAARSQFGFDRIYIIPEEDIDSAVGYLFPHNKRSLPDLITDQLDQWMDPLASKATNQKFNFLQYRSHKELPYFSIIQPPISGSCCISSATLKAIKFRSRGSGDRTQFEEHEPGRNVFYYTGVTNHEGRYKLRASKKMG